jgi:hypothetical protein
LICCVFIGAEIELDVGFSAAQARMTNLARGGLLRRACDDAYRDLGTGLARVGPLGAAPGLSRLVAVRVTNMAVHEDFAVVAIRWEAAGPGGALFPALDADLKLTPAGDQATMLTVWGSTGRRSAAWARAWTGCSCIGSPRRPSGLLRIRSEPPSPIRPSRPKYGASGDGQSHIPGRSPARHRPHCRHC